MTPPSGADRDPLRTALATPETKRRYVRRLFSTIADRYDLITGFLSYGQDRRWKRRLTALSGVRPGLRALDLACGTGDIAYALQAGGALDDRARHHAADAGACGGQAAQRLAAAAGSPAT